MHNFLFLILRHVTLKYETTPPRTQNRYLRTGAAVHIDYYCQYLYSSSFFIRKFDEVHPLMETTHLEKT